MIKRLLPFIFATALGIVAVLVMQWHIGRQRRALDLERKKLYATYQAPIEVIVAKQDLPEGTTLAKEHLALRSIPRNFIQPYATTQAVEVLGLVTRAPMAEGEQVLRNKLQRPEEAVLVSSLSRVTPEGMRAVTIGTDALTGVGGFVRPGDVVDILWSFQLPGPDRISVGLCQTGPGSRHGCIEFGDFNQQHRLIHTRQQLSRGDGITDLDQHFVDALPGNLGTDDRFLPGLYHAVGGEQLRPVPRLRDRHIHRQRGGGLGRFILRGRTIPAGEPPHSGSRYH